MSYTPEYAPGKIMVLMRSDKVKIDENFAKILGKTLGYEFDEWNGRYNAFLYNTPEGKEDEACKEFEEMKDFVESAYRFDIKLERRFDKIDELKNIINDLDTFAENDKKFAHMLKKIKKTIEEEINF